MAAAAAAAPFAPPPLFGPRARSPDQLRRVPASSQDASERPSLGGGFGDSRAASLCGEARAASPGEVAALPAGLYEGREHDGAVLVAGVLICCAVAAEGAFLLMNSTGVGAGLGTLHPLGGLLTAALQVIGSGDVVSALSGAVGLWLCTNVYLLSLFESVQASYALLSTSLVGALLAWRCLVTLCMAPWCGILLSFTHPERSAVLSYFLALLYLVINVAILGALVVVLRTVSARSRLLQLELGLQTAADRKAKEFSRRTTDEQPLISQSLLTFSSEPSEEEEGRLFYYLPLVPVLLCYLFGLGVASTVWLLELFIVPGKVVGGWAFVTALPKSPRGHILEIFLYILTLSTAVVAALALVAYDKARQAARQLTLQLVNHTSEEGGEEAAEHAEACTEVLGTQSKCAKIILGCGCANLLRLVIFFPVTGVALYLKDLCKVHGYLSLKSSILQDQYAGSVPLTCHGGEVVTLLLVVLVAALDVYLQVGLGRFCWLHYQGKQSARKAAPSSYGAVREASTYVASGTLASSAPAKDSWLEGAIARIEKQADARASEVLKPVDSPRKGFRSLQAAPPPARSAGPAAFQPLASAPPA